MTQEEIIRQGTPIEPHCFETDREEQWYEVGVYEGATASSMQIDWEQRRYEIAKEVLASSFSTPMEGTSILSYVRSCVQVADILIEELKGGAK